MDRLLVGARHATSALRRGAIRAATAAGVDRRLRRLLGRPPVPELAPGDLCYRIETEIPAALESSRGSTLYVAGWCFHSARFVDEVAVAVDGNPHRVIASRMPRADVFTEHQGLTDLLGTSYHSGFWTVVPIGATSPGTHAVTLRVRLEGGVVEERHIGDVTVRPPKDRPPPRRPALADRRNPRVAICMATFNPPMDQFEQQIRSIRAQTHTNWICIINDDCSLPDIHRRMCALVGDDPQFVLQRNPRRLGFYHNFEACLRRVDDDVDFVALADQDDRWFPDKIATLIEAMSPGTRLAYSDMRIVSVDGRVIQSSFWLHRRNNHTDLSDLLLANTVTGAASLFERSLLDLVLPFPVNVRYAYHDHWIACMALATGEIAFVDRPLYEYVQHEENVLGHLLSTREPERRRSYGAVDLLPANSALDVVAEWEPVYFVDVIRTSTFAREIAVRAGKELHPRRRRVINRVSTLDSPRGAAWLAGRAVTRTHNAVTIGAERRLLEGIAWRWMMRRRTPWTPTARRPLRHGVRSSEMLLQPRETAHAGAASIVEKLAPLRLTVRRGAPQRVNLILPTIETQHFFGGYIGKLNLARKLVDRGYRVRLVAVDRCRELEPEVIAELESFSGLADLFRHVEVFYAFGRERAMTVSPDDSFIATTWWTAHIAHAAVAQTGRREFFYLIQEYEPFTFVMGSWAALAAESYTFPHRALFSTEPLRAYFRNHGIGVFAEGEEAGLRNSTSFRNAITDVLPRGRRTDPAGIHRLLFYARPEPHAARNMFELGVVALSEAIVRGSFPGRWEFWGIGSVDKESRLTLAPGVEFQIVPRMSQEAYRSLLAEFDLGLALMYTPHPSLVPLEMAAAGMWVVTNVFPPKDSAVLRGISTNILPASPSIPAISAALRTAAQRVDDLEARERGAAFDWPRSWDDALDASTMQQIVRLLEPACDGD